MNIGFLRAMRALGIGSGTPRSAEVFAAIRALANADDLPGPMDMRAKLAPGFAYVRRVPGQNLWIGYRYDDEHVRHVEGAIRPSRRMNSRSGARCSSRSRSWSRTRVGVDTR